MCRLTHDSDTPSRLAACRTSIRFWAGPQWPGAGTAPGALCGCGFGCTDKQKLPVCPGGVGLAIQPAKCPGRHTVTLLTFGPSHGKVRRTSHSTLHGFTASTSVTSRLFGQFPPARCHISALLVWLVRIPAQLARSIASNYCVATFIVLICPPAPLVTPVWQNEVSTAVRLFRVGHQPCYSPDRQWIPVAVPNVTGCGEFVLPAPCYAAAPFSNPAGFGLQPGKGPWTDICRCRSPSPRLSGESSMIALFLNHNLIVTNVYKPNPNFLLQDIRPASWRRHRTRRRSRCSPLSLGARFAADSVALCCLFFYYP